MRTIFSFNSNQEEREAGICVGSGSLNSNVTDLGVYWIRRAFRWSLIERTRGTYDWSTSDEAVDRCEALGVNLMGPLANAPTWAQLEPGRLNGRIIPECIPDFVKFCEAIALRYGDRVAAYEVWNEAEGNAWSSSEYASILLAASAVIKPRPVIGMVMNGSFVDANRPIQNAWCLAVLSTPGVLDACDDLSIHTYCRPYSPDIGDFRGPIPTRLDNTADLLDSLGWTRPVWVTESGWPTEGDTPGVVTEEEQALYITQLADICRDRGVLYFPFQLYGSVTTSEAGGMGLIRPDGTRKPSFNAYRDWISGSSL